MTAEQNERGGPATDGGHGVHVADGGYDECRAALKPRQADRRVRKTIAALHEAVLDLLPEKPFETITVQDIAQRADVSRTAFYSHFPDKFALMEHIVSDVFDRSLERMMTPPPASTALAIRRIFAATCDYLANIFSQCRHARRLLDPLIQARVSERLRRELAVLLAPSATEAGQDAELTATVLSWSLYGAALEWVKNPAGRSIEHYVEQSFPVVCAAIPSQGNLDA